ncbi:MAG: LPS export ABC transporter periplasmic protein LptC [Spirochaetia bacterium]|nr:LPS export ABC transporter periplasmic protein LptC [Spirochaetia bacterium]
MKPFLVLIILIISLFSYSCSIDEAEAQLGMKGIAYPDIQLQEANYQISRGDNNPIFVKGKTIEIYKEINKTYITEASFIQYNNEKEILLKGNFGRGEIDTLTNDIELENSVSLTIYPDELLIQGISLTYFSENKIVKGKENEVITLTNKKGDILKGKGFEGNIEKVTFEFSQLEEGVLTYE